NAFDAALISELTEAFADVGDARAVLLAGDGESFCAGADVDWQRSAIDLSYGENVEDALRLYRMLETIDTCPVPVVGRVQGYALGGGSGLVCCTGEAADPRAARRRGGGATRGQAAHEPGGPGRPARVPRQATGFLGRRSLIRQLLVRTYVRCRTLPISTSRFRPAVSLSHFGLWG